MLPPEQHDAGQAVGLQDLPVETIIDILQSLDIQSIDSVSKVSKRIKRIVETNWAVIFRPIINRDMTPVGPFLHVLSVCDAKVATPLVKLNFAISDEDVPSSEEQSGSDDDTSTSGEDDSSSEDGGSVDEDGEDGNVEDDDPGSIDDALAFKMDSPGTEGDAPGSTAILPEQWASELAYTTVFKVCRLVKAWEQEFHRLRFACPHHRRTLEPHELRRLRHGIYVWWRYACYFHDRACTLDGEDENVDSPIARMNFVRQFSTSQLHEIRDMWETIKSAVGREICPSVSAVRRQSVCGPDGAPFGTVY